MNRALWYLVFHSSMGRFKSRLARMKNPKYLIGAAFGTFYLLSVFGRRNGIGKLLDLPEISEQLSAFGGALCLVLLSVQWSLIFRTGGLRLTEAELEILLSAPLSRKDLIHYHLLKPQVGLLTASLFLDIFMHRIFAVQGYFSPLVLLWGCFNLLLFNQTFLNLVSLVPRWIWPNRLIQIFFCLILMLTAIGTFMTGLPESVVLPGFPLPGMNVFMRPFKSLAAGFFTAGMTSFLISLLIQMILILGLYIAIRLVPVDSARLEQGTLTRFKRRVRHMKRRSGAVREVNSSAPRKDFGGWFGTRASVIRVLMGKSMIGVWRFLPKLPITYIVPAFLCLWVFGLAMMGGEPDGRTVLAFLALFFAGLLIVIGGRLLHLDFRSELVHLEILRSFPVKGTQMVMSILAVNSMILGLIQFLLCLLFLVAIMIFRIQLQTYSPIVIGVSALMVLPIVAALFFLMENLLTLWLPGWFMQEPGESHSRGFDAMGKRILNLFVRLLGFGGLCILPFIFGGGLFFWVGGNKGLLFGSLVFSIVMLCELFPVIYLAGLLYDRIESFGDEAI